MDTFHADQIPELLARLVDKSLVQVDAQGRYGLLQLVRQFLQEEAARSDSADVTRAKHLHFYSELCAEKALAIAGQDLFETNDIFLKESENIRHAVEWSAAHADTWPLAAQIIEDTIWLHFIRGSMIEGITLASLVIENAPSDADPKILANAWALLATYQQLSDHPDAVSTCEKAMRLAEEAQCKLAMARAVFQYAYIALREGREEEVQPGVQRALELIREVPGVAARHLEFAILSVKASSALIDERFDDAKQSLEDCLAVCDVLHYVRGYAVVNGNLGHLHDRLGDYKSEHECALKALDTFLKLKDLRNLAGTIASAASGYWLASDYESATQVLGSAYAVWGRSEAVPDSIDYATAERWRERLEGKMGSAFSAAFEIGKAIGPAEMVERLLANPQPWA